MSDLIRKGPVCDATPESTERQDQLIKWAESGVENLLPPRPFPDIQDHSHFKHTNGFRLAPQGVGFLRTHTGPNALRISGRSRSQRSHERRRKKVRLIHKEVLSYNERTLV